MDALFVLWRDPLAKAALLLVGVVCLLPFVPAISPGQLAFFNRDIAYFIFLGLAAVAAWRSSSGVKHVEEKRFWVLLTSALLVWFLGDLVPFFRPARLPGEDVQLSSDLYFTLFYLAVLLACESKPHLTSGWTRANPVYRMESAGAVFFVAGFLIYVVLFPRFLNYPAYATLIPSMLYSVSFDLFLVFLFAYLSWGCKQGRWKSSYRLFALAFLCVALADLRNSLGDRNVPGFAYGTSWDLLWYPQFLLFIGVARLDVCRRRDGPRASAFRSPEASALSSPQLIGPLVFYALALPAVHLSAEVLGLFDPVTEAPRETLLLFYLVTQGSLALVHQVHLERRNRILRDELEAIQQQLQQARKMDALGRFAGGVAHDFNNLLVSVIGYTELLGSRPDLPEGVRRGVEQIREAGERAAALTRQLLTFSQRQVLQARLVDLETLVRGVEGAIRRALGANITYRCVTDGSRGYVRADPVQLERAILHLVTNARDAMPAGGEFTLELASVELDEVFVRRLLGVVPGPYMCLSATDNGAGMDPETLAHVFEPFYTTKSKRIGAGLGLSLLYAVVKQSDGHVEISSEPARGTTVWIYLPRVMPAEAQPCVPVAPLGREAAAKTILLVQDEFAVLKMNRVVLEEMGCRVLTASNGMDAIRVAREFPGVIDLLLADAWMPEMSGRRLADHLRSQRPHLKLLFVSDLAEDSALPQIPRETGAAFLQKPYGLTDLARKVRELLDTSAQDAPADGRSSE